MPVNYANWWIMTTVSSRSAASASSSDWRLTLYYKPVPVSESTLRIMARIDALYLEDPTTGSRRTVQYLAREGVSRHRKLSQRRHQK
jgi:hypothetical protein